jgi:hypothetical protein
MKTVDFFHALPGLRPTDSRIGATQRNGFVAWYDPESLSETPLGFGALFGI